MNKHDFNLQSKNISFECTSNDGKMWDIRYQAVSPVGIITGNLDSCPLTINKVLSACRKMMKAYNK